MKKKEESLTSSSSPPSSSTSSSSPPSSSSSASSEVKDVDSHVSGAENRRPRPARYFLKKRNISGDGTLYERNFATVCFLRGIHRHEDFFLNAAVDALYPFDDVQFETRDSKSLRSSVLQLKHKHGKTLTHEALLGWRRGTSRRRWRDKSFFLKGFHAGFCNIREAAEELQNDLGFINKFYNWEFILYTNCPVEDDDTSELWKAVTVVDYGNRDIATSCVRCGTGCFSLKDTYCLWQRFSPDFLAKFRLYAGQAGEDDMEQLIHEEISTNHEFWNEDPCEVIAYNLCNFIEKWLTKETMPLDSAIKEKFLKKLKMKKESNEYIPWFPLD